VPFDSPLILKGISKSDLSLGKGYIGCWMSLHGMPQLPQNYPTCGLMWEIKTKIYSWSSSDVAWGTSGTWIHSHLTDEVESAGQSEEMIIDGFYNVLVNGEGRVCGASSTSDSILIVSNSTLAHSLCTSWASTCPFFLPCSSVRCFLCQEYHFYVCLFPTYSLIFR
jgi:hypothetical protein